jgi:FAD:protein FMN transferase
MPLVETLPAGADTAQWHLWSTTARLVVTDPAAVAAARAAVDEVTRAVEAASSRFRPDSELALLPSDGRPARVSPLLAELVAAGVRAAERTGGAVDPALGASLSAAGYDRTFTLILDGPHRVLAPAAQAWRRIRIDGDLLTVPAGVRLDLGATAKAWAADRAARAAADASGAGVLVALGGDIATAGEAPGGWNVLVRDDPRDGSQRLTLDAGGALATSSTVARTWTRDGVGLHHVLDPRTGAPAEPVWRTVSVAAATCEDANTLTTAAIVRGADAALWLRSFGLPARLVRADGRIVTMGGWPGGAQAERGSELS